ncbi:MAG: VOC family protein, partial [Chloroflexi bacterium]|nr:VOC family protein [Chloroflexota bacterium]
MVKPKQLGHLVIRVRDLDESEKFYEDVLGLHVTNRRPGSRGFLNSGGDA